MAEEKLTKRGHRFKDISGHRYGRLTVLYLVSGGRRTKWMCICDCGNTTAVLRSNLGSTHSCGCYASQKAAERMRGKHPANFNDLTGQVFGRLKVLDCIGKAHGNAVWRCQCSCGREHTANSLSLKSGSTQSCGCYGADSRKTRSTTHGLSHTRAYDAWYNAKERCFNPEDSAYSRYGARGITMCDEWAQSFERFLRDMGHCPDGLTIERIDNDGPYAPENCKWATRKEQMRNRRSSSMYTHNGETHCLSEWAEITGISRSALQRRFHRGTPPMFSPPQKRRRKS